MIDCIILTGGAGTRLRPIVSDRPKPLALIQGVPFLNLLISQVKPIAKKIILAVSYLKDQIIANYPNCSFSLEEHPLGTGGAIKKALAQVTTEHVLVMNGDSFLDFDFHPFLEAHRKKNGDVTILYRSTPDASRYGTLQMELDRIVGFHEKKEGAGLVSTGVYLFKSDAFQSLGLGEVFSLEKEAFPLLLKRKKMFGLACDGFFIDIGTPESYREAQNQLQPFLTRIVS
jgi:D-glycero-alpha-D-manno-heptose 1-phosphate guanylyltransferase